MTSLRSRVPLAALVALAATAAVLAAEPAAPDETRAEVPALTSLHEVVYPLWHDAWPSRNFELVADLLPGVRERVAAVRSAELPGILRDRKKEWDAGVSALSASLDLYEKAVAARDETGMLDAVEALHADFERLVRVVRPAMRELDAYHVELYVVYHRILPGKDLDRMPAAADAMAEKCRALAAAAVPKRFAAEEEQIRREIGILCRETEGLREAARGRDPEAVAAAVETVHERYRKLEAIFR